MKLRRTLYLILISSLLTACGLTNDDPDRMARRALSSEADCGSLYFKRNLFGSLSTCKNCHGDWSSESSAALNYLKPRVDFKVMANGSLYQKCKGNHSDRCGSFIDQWLTEWNQAQAGTHPQCATLVAEAKSSGGTFGEQEEDPSQFGTGTGTATFYQAGYDEFTKNGFYTFLKNNCGSCHGAPPTQSSALFAHTESPTTAYYQLKAGCRLKALGTCSQALLLKNASDPNHGQGVLQGCASCGQANTGTQMAAYIDSFIQADKN